MHSLSNLFIFALNFYRMEIRQNISLKSLNTFGIDVIAKRFVSVHSVNDIEYLYSSGELKNIFILNGGSNMLLTKQINKLVVHLELKGRFIVSQDDDSVCVAAMAGEDWPSFVNWTVENNYYGLENLTDIPGRVGSSPIQNIGAYGVEMKDSFSKLEAFNLESGNIEVFEKDQCEFGYRDSVFKNKLKGKYIILKVYFKLLKKANLRVEYGAIKQVLSLKNIEVPNLKELSQAISEIRSSKLPNPKDIGNSGSFFKNPVISIDFYNRLLEKFPDLPFYPIDKQSVKVPAGWLIDSAGWKGHRKGDAGVHANQALVLVNHGNASGMEVLELAQSIQADIKSKFSINLEMEVNVF